MSQGSAINKTIAQGVVNSSPPTVIEGQTNPLSLTYDGSLRVSSLENQVGFFSKNQEDAWGNLQPDLTFDGSVWNSW